MPSFSKNKITTKKTILFGLSIISLFILSSGIVTNAQWPNQAENEDCNIRSTSANPCRSLSRLPGSDGEYGTDQDEWVSSDRSLNIDTSYSYRNEDGHSIWENQNRQQMTPKAPNDRRDENGNMVFCATESHYNIGATSGGSTVQDETASEVCNNQVRKSESANGYMLYGPYLTSLENGLYSFTTSIKVENIDPNAKESDNIFRIDAWPHNFRKIVTVEDVKGEGWQEYELFFEASRPDLFQEFRVRTFGLADVYVDNIRLIENLQADEDTLGQTWTYLAKDAHSINGELVFDPTVDREVRRRPANGSSNMQFGPYSREQALLPGRYKVEYYLKTEQGTTQGERVAIIDISSTVEGRLDRLSILDADFDSTNTYQSFELEFEVPEGGLDGRLEFRAWGTQEGITIDKTVVTKIS